MDLLIITAGLLVVLLCVLLMVLCIIVMKLLRRMPEVKRDRAVTELYGLAESVRYGIADGELSAAELKQIMAGILSVITVLSGLKYEDVEKEFSEPVSDETDAYFLSITSDEDIIPTFQKLTDDELVISEEMNIHAGKSHFYGIISAPANARLTLSVRSKNQSAPDWRYIPTDENNSNIVRIPFRIMYPGAGWDSGQYNVYFSLMDESLDIVFDHVGVEVTFS